MRGTWSECQKGRVARGRAVFIFSHACVYLGFFVLQKEKEREETRVVDDEPAFFLFFFGFHVGVYTEGG